MHLRVTIYKEQFEITMNRFPGTKSKPDEGVLS